MRMVKSWPGCCANSLDSQHRPIDSFSVGLKRLDVTDVVVTPAVAGTPWQALLDPAQADPLQLVGQEPNGDLHYRVP